MKRFKKDILFFILVFITLSLIVHSDKWFSAPLEHLSSLSSHPMPYHPFLYALLVFILLYIVIYLVKSVIRLFKKLVVK